MQAVGQSPTTVTCVIKTLLNAVAYTANQTRHTDGSEAASIITETTTLYISRLTVAHLQPQHTPANANMAARTQVFSRSTRSSCGYKVLKFMHVGNVTRHGAHSIAATHAAVANMAARCSSGPHARMWLCSN